MRWVAAAEQSILYTLIGKKLSMILCFFDFGLCVCKPAEFSEDVTLKLTFLW